MASLRQLGWKGGVFQLLPVTESTKRIRTSFKYLEWRKEGYQRDNYTCVDCGKTGGYLNFHHIIEFHTLLKDNNIKTIEDALECNYLWDLNNGETLCNKCHKLKHDWNYEKEKKEKQKSETFKY